MRTPEFDADRFAQDIIDGFVLPHESIDSSGYFLAQILVGSEVVYIDTDEGFEVLMSAPNEQVETTNNTAEPSNYFIQNWTRNSGSSFVTTQETEFPDWIIALARSQGLGEQIFGPDHATTIGHKVLAILRDINNKS